MDGWMDGGREGGRGMDGGRTRLVDALMYG